MPFPPPLGLAALKRKLLVWLLPALGCLLIVLAGLPPVQAQFLPALEASAHTSDFVTVSACLFPGKRGIVSRVSGWPDHWNSFGIH